MIYPSEVLVMPRDAMLLFHRNHPVIPLRLYKYFNVKRWETGGVGREGGAGLGSGMLAASLLVVGLMAAVFAAYVQPPTLQTVPFDPFMPAPDMADGQAIPGGNGMGGGVGPAWQQASGPPRVRYVPPGSPYGQPGYAPLPYGGGMGSPGYRQQPPPYGGYAPVQNVPHSGFYRFP